MKNFKKKSIWLALPFFAVLGALTVTAYCIPLRPTVSYYEKRELTKFPEFSMSSLLSGDYFDGITAWFSDTFPGREQWLELSGNIQSLYGNSDVYIAPALPAMPEPSLAEVSPAAPSAAPTQPTAVTTPPTVAEAPSPTNEAPQTEAPAVSTQPEEMAQMEPPATEVPPTEAPAAPTQPEEEPQAATEISAAPAETPEESPVEATQETTWGGIDVGAEEAIGRGAVIQIGESAFSQMGFNEAQCKRYGESLSHLAEVLPDVRIISAPAPTAIGIMVEGQYLESLNCARQDMVQETLHGYMSDNVVKVDVFSNLVQHNNEYIYFRTDHHWTALGAYYAYEALCQATGLTPAPLDSFTPWDQGLFIGSLLGQARWPAKLKKDDCVAYIPEGDITMLVSEDGNYRYELPLLRDVTNANPNEKYLTFLSSDHALCEITNNSLPEGTACLLIKDSFGNCFAPYLTQNYHKVYAMDYRKYMLSGIRYFVEQHEVQDIIFSPYLIATQSTLGNDLIGKLCYQ